MLALCSIDAIPDGDARGFAVEGPQLAQRLLVARRGERVYGYVNLCPHALSRLDFEPGEFMDDDGRYLYCGVHGAQFGLEDGNCVSGPCLGQALVTAPIVLRDGTVFLDRDDVALVDEISKVMSDLG